MDKLYYVKLHAPGLHILPNRCGVMALNTLIARLHLKRLGNQRISSPKCWRY